MLGREQVNELLAEVEKVSVLGSRLAVLEIDETVAELERAVRERNSGYVCFCNVHTTVTGLFDGAFRNITNDAYLAVADGMPLTWAMRMLEHGPHSRSYGPGVMRKLLERSREQGHRHFFYGGSEAALAGLRSRFEDAHIAGTLSPPFRALSAEEEQQHIDTINRSNADFVWVAFGAPRQERWMARMRAHLSAPLLLGVGQAFDVLSGQKEEPPMWMMEAGLEWAFRLAKEPRRLARRYLVTNPVFLVGTAIQVAGKKLLDRATRPAG